MHDNRGIVVGLKNEVYAFSDKYKYPNVWMEGHEMAELLHRECYLTHFVIVLYNKTIFVLIEIREMYKKQE